MSVATSGHRPLIKAFHLGTGNILAQAIGIFTMPILSRIYSPSHYGHLGLYLSVAAILAGVSTFRFELGILNSSEDSAAKTFASASFRLSALLSALFGLGYALIPAFQESYFSDPKWLSGLILGVLCFLSSLQLILRYLFLRSGHQKTLLAAAPAQGATRAASQYLFSKISLAGGLLVGELLSRLPPILLLARRSTWRGIFSNRQPLASTVRAHAVYPRYLLPSFLIDTLAQALPMLYLGKLFGLEAVGLFAMQQRLWQIPLQVVSDGSADVIHTVFAQAHASDNRQQIKKAFARSTLILLALALFCAVFFGGLGPTLVPWALGEKWTKAGELAALTTPWYAAAIVVSPISRLIMVTGKLKAKLLYDLLTLGSIVIICESASRKGWSLETTTLRLSWTYFATYALYFYILLQAIKAPKVRATA